MIPAVNSEDPANGRFMETAGIEPAINAPRKLVLANEEMPAICALVDSDVVGLERWTWRLVSSNRGKAYVLRNTTDKHGRHRRIYLHRLVLGLKPDDHRRVDHINGDTLDNRRANLRIVTDAQNAQNQGSRGGSSQFRGVTWDKARGKWMATGMLDGRHKTIGRFDLEQEAADAAMAWRAEHMPFSAEAAA